LSHFCELSHFVNYVSFCIEVITMNQWGLNDEVLIKILNNVNGTILVADKDERIIFANNVVLKIFNLSFNDIYRKTIDELIDSGLFINSATKAAFTTKQLAVKYVRGKMDTPILTISNPVRDRNGDVEMVVAFSIDEILLENIVNEMAAEKNNARQLLSYLSNSDSKNVPIVAESRAMQEIIALLARISQVDSTVLLTGESGTGKEVLSRFIHKSSPRSAEVFIPVNCAAIPSELMESEFFGYARGAFTGATREGKAGFFELADNGTLFLDEIAEMPLAIQSKFLRVLETGDVKRLGAEKDKHVNVRVIAATNKNLYQMVQEGSFREDLYYRLNVIPIRIPPLRERPADILPLAKVFLNNFNRKYGLNRIFSHEAVKKLQSYPWPGNVRELRNVIERLVIASDSNILSFHSADKTPALKITEQFYTGTSSVPDVEANEGRPLKDIMREYEQKVVLATIDHYNGSVAKAAAALKLHKSALYRKLESYNKDTLI